MKNDKLIKELKELREEVKKLREELAVARLQQPIYTPYYPPQPYYPYSPMITMGNQARCGFNTTTYISPDAQISYT